MSVHARTLRLRGALRALLAVFAVAALLLLVVWPEAAYLAAWPLPVLLLLLLAVDRYERAARPADLRPAAERAGAGEVELNRDVAGLTLVLKIGAILAVAALAISATVLELRYVGLGAAVVFLYLLFLGFPYWVAAVAEADEDALESATGRRGPS